MTRERRKHPRIGGPFEGSWSGSTGTGKCRVSDVSVGGCFVQTLAAPAVNDPTVVTIRFGPDRTMKFSGRVAYVERHIGFAVRFDPLNPDVEKQLGEALGLKGPAPAGS